MMKVLVLSVAAVLGLSGCGASTKEPAAPPAPAAPAPALADEVDAMCACKTPACATKVHADFTALDHATPAAASAAPHTTALATYLKTCEATAREGDDLVTLGAYRDDICACKDVECVDKVNQHYASWMAKMERKYRDVKTPRKDFMEVGEQISKCMGAAMSPGGDDDAPSAHHSGGVDGKGAPDATPGDALADLGGTTGVPACDVYLRAFDQYLSCPKIPQQAKDASMQGIEQMKQGWAMLKDPDVPAEAKHAASDACKQAVDALRQSAAAMGCPM